MDNLLSTKEAASYLCVGKSTLLNLFKCGLIRGYRPSSKKIFFKKEWLDEFIEKNTIKAV
ncbi:MAG: excisionase family DNA-binding protein [Lachnospiraceae bacterium]|nr:excisionase family DNA-binding protein [Lachnospiraceae bacterium]